MFSLRSRINAHIATLVSLKEHTNNSNNNTTKSLLSPTILDLPETGGIFSWSSKFKESLHDQ